MRTNADSPPSHNLLDAIRNSIRDIIRNELSSRGIKLTQLAAELDVSYDRLVNMLGPKERTPLPDFLVDRIRDCLKMPSSWPYDVLRDPAPAGFSQTDQSHPPYGFTMLGSDPMPAVVPVEYIGRHWLGLVMPDDSMMPSIAPGDFLAVDPRPKPRIGYPHCVIIDGEHTVRIIDHDGQDYVVRAHNPRYAPASLDSRLVGIVVGRVYFGPSGDRLSRLNELGLLFPDPA